MGGLCKHRENTKEFKQNLRNDAKRHTIKTGKTELAKNLRTVKTVNSSRIK